MCVCIYIEAKQYNMKQNKIRKIKISKPVIFGEITRFTSDVCLYKREQIKIMTLKK